MKGYRILVLILAIFIFLPVPVKASESLPILKYEVRNENAVNKFEREEKLTQMIKQTMGIFLLLSVSNVILTVYDIQHLHE